MPVTSAAVLATYKEAFAVAAPSSCCALVVVVLSMMCGVLLMRRLRLRLLRLWLLRLWLLWLRTPCGRFGGCRRGSLPALGHLQLASRRDHGRRRLAL